MADAGLGELRHGLVRLHKALVDSERVEYERINGRLSAGELLQRIINDPFFAWLRPVSELVVRIDELLDADEPPGDDEARAVRGAARALLTPQEPGLSLGPPTFGTRYHEAIQRDPAVVLAHGRVSRLLAAG